MTIKLEETQKMIIHTDINIIKKKNNIQINKQKTKQKRNIF